MMKSRSDFWDERSNTWGKLNDIYFPQEKLSSVQPTFYVAHLRSAELYEVLKDKKNARRLFVAGL